ncbi:MAG TPA: hypothetical protein PLB89_10870, partial [Flavobacteriales bacterium]|nr:hypothetical protein [Flavobacteriales bacterium]
RRSTAPTRPPMAAMSPSVEERVQALTPVQLEEMARAAGFIVEDRTDGPELVPFDPQHSQRYVLWMRRSSP